MNRLVSPRAALLLLTAGSIMPAFGYTPDFCERETQPLPFTAEISRPRLLYPELKPNDFPRASGELRLQRLHADGEQVIADGFHRRGEHHGLAGRITLTRGLDPRTGLRRMSVSRLDEDCLAAADAARLDPNAVCAQAEAIELQRDVYELQFRNRMANHQLRFWLLPAAGDTWTMLASGRRGEPQRLTLSGALDSTGDWRATWSVAAEHEGATFKRELTARLDAGFVADRLDAFAAGLLGSLSFFDELSDEHRDWVVQQEIVDTMEPTPDNGDDDIYGCEPADGVCSAEYDTCVPTPEGWLGCNFDPFEPGWGSGVGDGDEGGGADHGGGGGNGNGNGDGDGGGVFEPAPLPDWRVGSLRTEPRFPSPIFHGMHVDFDIDGSATHQGFSFDLTSVLQRAGTVPKPTLQPPHTISGHAVGYFLTTQTGTEIICGLMRVNPTDAAFIPIGDFVHYRSPDALCAREGMLRCDLEAGRIYVLNYHLDPTNLWDEGSDGEANNFGRFRGYHIED